MFDCQILRSHTVLDQDWNDDIVEPVKIPANKGSIGVPAPREPGIEIGDRSCTGRNLEFTALQRIPDNGINAVPQPAFESFFGGLRALFASNRREKTAMLFEV